MIYYSRCRHFFAGDDVVDANGLDKARMPSEVLAAAQPFVATRITANNLPKPKMMGGKK